MSGRTSPLMTNTQSLSVATRQLFAGDSAFAFWLVGGTLSECITEAAQRVTLQYLYTQNCIHLLSEGFQKVCCPAPLCRSCFSLRSNEVLNFYGEKATYFWYCNKNTITQTTNKTKQNNSKRKQKQSQEERERENSEHRTLLLKN